MPVQLTRPDDVSGFVPNPFYYLDNFQCVLDWVVQRYSDMLSAQEHGFAAQFQALPRASQALLTRMIMRRGPLFRASRLCYDEIGCPHEAAGPLIKLGWLVPDPEVTLDELFSLLNKPEIVATPAFGLGKQPSSQSKSGLLDLLRLQLPAALHRRAWSAWELDLEEQVYLVTITAWCERMRLMFFGNLRQGWAEFVLSDLGIYRYEAVVFSSSARALASRQDMDDYLHLHRCRERLEQGETLDDIAQSIPDESYANGWIEQRRNALLFRLAQQYERGHEFEAALSLYQRCVYPGARLRQIRVAERLQRWPEAHVLALFAINNPENEAEQQALQRILPRLHKKLRLTAAPITTTLATAGPSAVCERIDICLPYPVQSVSVEQAVCLHLSDTQAPVRYVENTLINSLFGLLCWTAIFAPLPGAFFHPFHHGPADLLSADFYTRRRALFDACLAQLDGPQYQQIILATFHAKQGIRSPFVYWGALDAALLQLALRCLPPAHLKKYFLRILQDIGANRSGLPDLIQFWPDEQRYRLLEVKGPGDRLQDNQIRWLNYCMEHGMPCAVCYVAWAGEQHE